MGYIKVYHSAFGDGFKLVAIVETDSKEEAYRLTNNIEDSWLKNPEVRSFVPATQGGARSTSVGDYMRVVSDKDHSFTEWRVAGCGFQRVFDWTEVEYMGYNEEKTERFFETLTFGELKENYGDWG